MAQIQSRRNLPAHSIVELRDSLPPPIPKPGAQALRQRAIRGLGSLLASPARCLFSSQAAWVSTVGLHQRHAQPGKPLSELFQNPLPARAVIRTRAISPFPVRAPVV